MDKFGSFIILTREKLIVEYHRGDINIYEFMNSRKIISSDKNYDPNFDVIFDFRDANMIADTKEIDKFIDFFHKYVQIIGNRKSAYLTSKPEQLVITTLFSEGIKDQKVHPMTFSTLPAVVEWIDNKYIDTKRLGRILNEIKKHPNPFYSQGHSLH